jgi:hypothetical protein
LARDVDRDEVHVRFAPQQKARDREDDHEENT